MPFKNRPSDNNSLNMRFLIESELNKAEVILASKSIMQTLQDIAERVAKIEVNDLMPLLDSFKEAFGQQLSEQFGNVTADELHELVSKIRATKDRIGDEILNLEKNMRGEPTSDMATSDEYEDDELPPVEADDEDEDGTDKPKPEVTMKKTVGFPNRELKDSYISRSDRRIIECFSKLVDNGHTVGYAAEMTALLEKVDTSDVLIIVKEAVDAAKVKKDQAKAWKLTAEQFERVTVKGKATPEDVARVKEIMAHVVTVYDRAEEAKEIKRGGRVNIYRLGLLLKATDAACASIRKLGLAAALKTKFNDYLLTRLEKAFDVEITK